MFAPSEGGCMKTSHNQSSDEQIAYNVKKRPRFEDPLCGPEMIIQKAKDSLMKSDARKHSNQKKQNEKIQTLQTTIGIQKAEINLLNTQIKKFEFSLQTEINQRKDVNDRVGRTRKFYNILKEDSSKIKKVLQKCQENQYEMSVWYKKAVEMKDQLQNCVQKYQADLHEVQKQLESEQKLRLELINNWNDKNSRTNEFVDHLKNQISLLEEAMQNLKLKEDESAIREKQNQEEIINLTTLVEQKEQFMKSMKMDFKSINDNLYQQYKDLSKSSIEDKNRISQLEDQLDETKLTFKERDAKCKVFEEKILDLNDKIDTLIKEAKENCQFYEKNVTNLQMSKDSLINLNSTLTNVKIELEEEISHLKQELEENKTFMQEKCNEQYVLQKRVKDLEKGLETLEKEKENVETSLSVEFFTKLKVATSSHDEDKKKYESNILNLQDELKTKSQKIIELISEGKLTLKKLNECESNLENTTSKLESSNEDLRILNDIYNKEIDELKEKLANTENMYVDVVDELKALKESTNKHMSKVNLSLNAEIFTRSNIFDPQGEKTTTTTRNSPKQVKNNEINKGAASPNLKAKSLEIDFCSDDNAKSCAQLEVLKRDKKKVSATQKETVTSTNRATSKKSSRFSTQNKKRVLFNI